MTTNEARYVLAHREMYTIETYLYALEIVEQADREQRLQYRKDES